MSQFVPAGVEAIHAFLSVEATEQLKAVEDSTIPPLDAVCRLIKPGSPLLCTAVAITPRILLTAGHNLISTGARSVWTACPAYNGRDFAPRVKGLREVKHPNWEEFRDPEYDIGLLLLAGTVSSTIAPTRWTEAMNDAPVYVVGYGEGHPKLQTFDTGRVVGGLSNLLMHSCATERGHSGAPVFAPRSSGVRFIATHAYAPQALQQLMPGNFGKAVRFTEPIYDWISTTVQQFTTESGNE